MARLASKLRTKRLPKRAFRELRARMILAGLTVTDVCRLADLPLSRGSEILSGRLDDSARFERARAIVFRMPIPKH